MFGDNNDNFHRVNCGSDDLVGGADFFTFITPRWSKSEYRIEPVLADTPWMLKEGFMVV